MVNLPLWRVGPNCSVHQGGLTRKCLQFVQGCENSLRATKTIWPLPDRPRRNTPGGRRSPRWVESPLVRGSKDFQNLTGCRLSDPRRSGRRFSDPLRPRHRGIVPKTHPGANRGNPQGGHGGVAVTIPRNPFERTGAPFQSRPPGCETRAHRRDMRRPNSAPPSEARGRLHGPTHASVATRD